MKRIRSFKLIKWTFYILILMLIASIIYFVFLYIDVQQNKQKGFSQAKENVLRTTPITETDNVIRFHGDEAYYVVFGKTKNAEEKIVFVPFKENSEQEFTIIDQSSIKPREHMMNEWNKQCNKCKLIKIIPGIIDDEPIWEVTYIDSSDRYVFDYFSIFDGSPYEQFRFKKMFK